MKGGFKMTKKTILKTEIKREKGFLYYCGTDEDGNITIGRSDKKGSKKSQSSE